ncbi:NUDIX domain-containing protein [Actinomadura fulvescens]|uniref:NUDIX domain-containing protein n=1 Tax=Actinomadura fulvescens TaxID=46160 RepID=UPI003979DC04
MTHAAVREALEEIGVHLAEDDLEFVHLIHYRNHLGHARLGVFFTARNWKGEPRNAEPCKCSAVRWFPLDDLPASTYPYTVQGLAAYRRGIPFNAVAGPDQHRRHPQLSAYSYVCRSEYGLTCRGLKRRCGLACDFDHGSAGGDGSHGVALPSVPSCTRRPLGSGCAW